MFSFFFTKKTFRFVNKQPLEYKLYQKSFFTKKKLFSTPKTFFFYQKLFFTKFSPKILFTKKILPRKIFTKKLNNSNCDQTQIVRKLKNSNCNKTQKLKL